MGFLYFTKSFTAMKQIIYIICLSLIATATLFAQNNINSKGISYQGYARDAEGTALGNTSITVRFTITETGTSTSSFSEEHALTTDAFGVFSTIIGSVSTSDFQALTFGSKSYHLKIEAKTNSTSYTTLSDSPLLAVPYAKAADHANSASSATTATSATSATSATTATTALNGVPVGTILPFAGTTAPSGFLVCDGQAVNRTGTYADLYTAIGTNWGSGNNSTTFNVPDLRGMFLRGYSGSSNDDPNKSTRTSRNGGQSGNNVGSYQASDNKSHNHTGSTGSAGSHTHNVLLPMDQAGSSDITTIDANVENTGGDDEGIYTFNNATSSSGSHTHTVTINNNGGTEARPRNVYVLYIIKY